MDIYEKMAYLKGLLDGMEVADSKEKKLFAEIIDVLDELVEAVGDLYEGQDELQEYVESIDTDLEDAEEIVQDSLLWIWENRENLFIETSLSSYLFKMIYRKALNKLAHIDATQRADTRFYEEMQEMLQDTDLYQVEELTQRIKDAIATLPESYREAFVMHRFRDMSYKEIAEILGVSPKTVDYRIQQALKQLRVDLKDYLPLLLPILFP